MLNQCAIDDIWVGSVEQLHPEGEARLWHLELDNPEMRSGWLRVEIRGQRQDY